MARDIDRERDWTERDARQERVGVQACINCRRKQENLAPSNVLFSLETNEKLCRECLERFREHTRTVHIDMWVDSELDDVAEDVVRDSFRYLSSQLEEATEVVVAEADGPHPIGLAVREVDDEAVDEARETPAVEP